MKKKKIIASVLAIAIIVTSFAFGFNAYAKSQKLILDNEYIDTTDGNEDLLWYYFTPEVSGTYTFLSFNTQHSEAYLFTKSVADADRTMKTLTQLAYSQSSPNYQKYGQSSRFQFCLTYHLEAGQTYYYAAGIWLESTTKSKMKVKLICEEYDREDVESVAVECNAALTWYTDGEWRTDAAKNTYFYYNYNKIIQNMTITVNYTDGTSSTVSNGAESIDGYSIQYTETQSENHWYVEEDENYTGNVLTISVLGKSIDYNVVINKSALRTVKLKVTDYTGGEPVENAGIALNGSDVATTGADGTASFAYASGIYTAKITAPNAFPRTVQLRIASTASENDHTDTPVPIIVGDYVPDGLINAKDYGYILHQLTGSKRQSEKEKFRKQINFTADEYTSMTL